MVTGPSCPTVRIPSRAERGSLGIDATTSRVGRGIVHAALPLSRHAAGRASLAACAGLSECTFHRRFVAATGETPARFVETARLDEARMLLSRGPSLKSVAAEVGLFPPARLAEAFECRFGVAPRLFRDMQPNCERR
ncbi:helix-turn-helix domain-containing protein [Shinella sp.]|uniref:helix-turn-helix domain-containing protein n=1 Tax=Shinella sp. TaxID=1870904 RepID=UPI0039E4F642